MKHIRHFRRTKSAQGLLCSVSSLESAQLLPWWLLAKGHKHRCNPVFNQSAQTLSWSCLVRKEVSVERQVSAEEPPKLLRSKTPMLLPQEFQMFLLSRVT